MGPEPKVNWIYVFIGIAKLHALRCLQGPELFVTKLLN